MYGKFGIIGATAMASLASLNWQAPATTGGATVGGTLEVLRSLRPDVALCMPGPQIVTATVLKVRAVPVGGEVIGRLRRGTHVNVSGCDGNWAELRPGRWVHARYLAVAYVPPRRSAAPPAAAGKIAMLSSEPAITCLLGPHYVTADALNVRTRPADGEILGRITHGEYVPVARCDGAWAEIGTGRWVHARYLSVTAPTNVAARIAASK